MFETPSTHWPRIFVLWLCGIFAAMQFSKTSLMLPYPLFFLTRVLEGASHLAVVVAAPTLMAAS